MNEALRAELLSREKADLDVRARLLAEGVLSDGYHPDMEAVHLANAARLDELIRTVRRFPGKADAGEDGAQAAWRILVHAISSPDFMRAAITLFEQAVVDGQQPAARLAALIDRVRYNEGKPQLYGTIFDWDDSGQLGVGPIEDQARVDERRAKAGLPPLAAALAAQRRAAAEAGEKPPKNPAAKRSELDRWARKVGWRA